MESNQMNYISFEEISSQPEAWSKIIPLVISQAGSIRKIFDGIEEVIFAGCGSGLNVSMSGASVLQAKTQISARAVPAVEIYKFSEGIMNKKRKSLANL